MTEWRDSDEWAASDKDNTYGNLTCDTIEHMANRIDGMMIDYVKGAVEGVHEYRGSEDGNAAMHRVTFEYNDFTTNAYQDPVVTDTVLEIQHNTYKTGVLTESYDINIARQIIVEGKNNHGRFAQTPFVECYKLLTYKGNERQAFVNQMDLTTEFAEMSESAMTSYDQSVLAAELDKIVDMYDTDNRKRAIIEK